MCMSRKTFSQVCLIFWTVVLVIVCCYLLTVPVFGEGPPPNAIQLLPDPSFENGGSGWTLVGDVWIDGVYPSEGLLALCMGGEDASGYAFARFDLAACKPGSVWVIVEHVASVPYPIMNPYMSLTEGWLADHQGVTVERLWDTYEVEEPDGYYTLMFEVDGLFGVLYPELTGMFFLGTVTNPPGMESIYDNVRLYCEPKDVEYEWLVFLPYIAR